MLAGNKYIIPVILSGGSGTRLWPLSNKNHPKQFLSLNSDSSLFAETLARTQGHPFYDPFVICNEKHRYLVAEVMRELNIKSRRIVLEPMSKNTGPAVSAIVSLVLASGNDDLVLILPSDHRITNKKAFISAVEKAAKIAQMNKIVNLGVIPTVPHPGYGYIKVGDEFNGFKECYNIQNFVEKPDKDTAESFIESGDFVWNSGIYLFRAKTMLNELEKFQPEIMLRARESVEKGKEGALFFSLNAESFDLMPSISIDHAIFEKTKNAVVVKVDMGWSDVGSWSAFRKFETLDDKGNFINGDVTLLDCENVYARSDGPLISVLGLTGIIVVAANDCILIIPEDRADDVRDLVKEIKSKKKLNAENNIKNYRPWGSYQNLKTGPGFLVKEIVVNPGAKISLQYHNHRAEQWFVVKGVAKVTRDGHEFELDTNQSIDIPLGAVHRLENCGKSVLRVIEIQFGTYLDEGDIVRLEDDFGRVNK